MKAAINAEQIAYHTNLGFILFSVMSVSMLCDFLPAKIATVIPRMNQQKKQKAFYCLYNCVVSATPSTFFEIHFTRVWIKEYTTTKKNPLNDKTRLIVIWTFFDTLLISDCLLRPSINQSTTSDQRYLIKPVGCQALGRKSFISCWLKSFIWPEN